MAKGQLILGGLGDEAFFKNLGEVSFYDFVIIFGRNLVHLDFPHFPNVGEEFCFGFFTAGMDGGDRVPASPRASAFADDQDKWHSALLVWVSMSGSGGMCYGSLVGTEVPGSLVSAIQGS
jgi:hypothetical protein